MWNAGLAEAQAGIKIPRKNIDNLRYAIITLMAESEEELKSLLLKVKEESEKSGLKLNIQNTKIMASRPITPWQTDGETMKTVRGLFSWVQNHGSHEIKRHSLEESYDQPRQHIKNQRHYFAIKGPSSQSYD